MSNFYLTKKSGGKDSKVDRVNQVQGVSFAKDLSTTVPFKAEILEIITFNFWFLAFYDFVWASHEGP